MKYRMCQGDTELFESGAGWVANSRLVRQSQRGAVRRRRRKAPRWLRLALWVLVIDILLAFAAWRAVDFILN